MFVLNNLKEHVCDKQLEKRYFQRNQRQKGGKNTKELLKKSRGNIRQKDSKDDRNRFPDKNQGREEDELERYIMQG